MQAITNPFGITVFGSAIIRVSPDVVSLNFAVSRLEKMPKDAFNHARDSSRAVRKFLNQNLEGDVVSSRVSLSQEHQMDNHEKIMLGYRARVRFHLITRELDRVEDLLIGVVDSGANEIEEMSFQTSKLRDYRQEARQKALRSAREKADNYCVAAGVSLGRVLHLEDVNPSQLTGIHEGHRGNRFPPEVGQEGKAFDPGAITVGGAVRVSYAIEP